ncbi:DNA-directed RNA polymerases I and III subunit RPAC1, partial [Clonorchis sinensis]
MTEVHNSSALYELKEHGIINHPGTEEEWSAQIFRSKFEVSIIDMSDTLEFDMVHIDCSFANALRRILIAEVPSISIERVYLFQNTSVMPDEVLCHRLGLIPLAIVPRHLIFPSRILPETDELTEFNPMEHVIFDFKVSFKKSDLKGCSESSGKEFISDLNLPSVRSSAVYSSELKWVPLPGQEELFGEDQPTVVSPHILINKLAVGDEIEARCVAVKGVGRDHAKFSPVAAAYYKFLPVIKLLRPIEGDEARLLQRSFAHGVIGIDPKTEQAYILNARLDNGSREHMRHPQFRDDAVFVGVDSSHCIFTVESIAPSQRPPARLVRSAIEVMIEKCGHYLAIVDKPGFGDVVVEGVNLVTPAGDRKSETGSFHSRLNDRDVGLEVAHMSRDKRRVTYTFHGEDHTLGLALRYCILHSTKATFCGYCVPHPLEDKIHFDVQVKNGSAHDALR